MAVTASIQGDWLVPPAAAITARLLKLSAPLSFWGGVDPKTSAIIQVRHPECGAAIAGTILAMPGAIGSSSSSAVLLELIRIGLAPAALVMAEPDAILLIASLAAREMGWPPVPALKLPLAAIGNLQPGQCIISFSGIIARDA